MNMFLFLLPKFLSINVVSKLRNLKAQISISNSSNNKTILISGLKPCVYASRSLTADKFVEILAHNSLLSYCCCSSRLNVNEI